MMTPNDIRDVRFSKKMNGYNQDEVDNFLDTVEEDYRQYESFIRTLQKKVDDLTQELEDAKHEQSAIQNMLVGAQKLADSTVAEAKAKAENIIAEAKAAADVATSEARGILENFDATLKEKKAQAEKEAAVKLVEAQNRQEAVTAATEDCVRRQQALFNKLKIEVASFKNDVMEQYKRHLDILRSIPDNVAMDAKEAAEAVSLVAEQVPDISSFVSETAEETPDIEEVRSVSDNNDIDSKDGFVVNSAFRDLEDAEEDTDMGGFSNKFFSRK